MKIGMLRASLFVLALSGCSRGRATRAECAEMLDKYLDMTIAGEVAPADLPPADAERERRVRKDLRKADPIYVKVQGQCEAEITKREYRCAMKTFTPEGWQACID